VIIIALLSWPPVVVVQLWDDRPLRAMYRITRKRSLVFAALAAIMLLGFAWRFREPSYDGKTVTEWLDRLVLYTYAKTPNGDAEICRAPEAIAADPAFHALMAIGSRGVPVLTQRISDPAEVPPGMTLSTRWRWAWYRLRGPTHATYPVTGDPASGGHWSETQKARKTAAAFTLLILGTNNYGGFIRLMEAYGTAPRFTSVYGGSNSLAGAPVGFIPSQAVRLACSIQPQIRDEIIAGVKQGLQHTNASCQEMAVNCARVFPELGDLVESRQKIQ
jgi:hypothetical protein